MDCIIGTIKLFWMRKYDVKELFKKLSQGTISKEELNHLDEWMAKQGDDGLSKYMDEDWSKFNQTDELLQVPKWMSNSADTPKAKLFSIGYRRWIAAASILFVVASGLLFLFLNHRTPRLVQQTNTKFRKELIQLPDGSQVWLKRNSTLSYWKPFQNQERILELNGEAFFDVATDSTRPFIVHSSHFKTQVLGTSFNIITGKDSTLPEVALVEGAVEISYNTDSLKKRSILLKPGEKARMDLTVRAIQTVAFSKDAPYAWKNDIIVFQKADVYEVARILEEWYNIQFTVEQHGVIMDRLVHRIDTKGKQLADVLRGISNVMPYTFHQVDQDLFIIKSK